MSANYKFYNSCGDTTSTVGTGTLILNGVVSNGYQTIISRAQDGDKLVCRIQDPANINWEISRCTYSAVNSSLSRDVVLDSSNARNLVYFSAGIKNIFIGIAAEDLANAVLTTAGDIAYHDGAGLARLPAGLPGQVLRTGTTPSWVSIESDKNYVHTQSSSASVWNVTHNLGKFPSAVVVDSAGTECEGYITYNDTNTATLTFSAPFSGKAYFN